LQRQEAGLPRRKTCRSVKSRKVRLQDGRLALAHQPWFSHLRTAQRPNGFTQHRAAKEIRPKCRLARHRDGSEHTGKTHTIQMITLRVVAPSMLTKRSPCSCCASPQHTRMRPSPAPATRKSCRNVTSSSMSRASTMERSTLTITNVDSITSSPTSSPQN